MGLGYGDGAGIRSAEGRPEVAVQAEEEGETRGYIIHDQRSGLWACVLLGISRGGIRLDRSARDPDGTREPHPSPLVHSSCYLSVTGKEHRANQGKTEDRAGNRTV